MTRTLFSLFLAGLSAGAFAEVLEGEFEIVSSHKYINEFYESNVSFVEMPGGSYREMFKCIWQHNTDQWKPRVECRDHDGTKSALVDAGQCKRLVKVLDEDGRKNLAPGAGNGDCLDSFKMKKTSVKNEVFDPNDDIPHYLLMAGDQNSEKRPSFSSSSCRKCYDGNRRG